MLATVARIENAFDPAGSRTVFPVFEPVTVGAWLEAQGIADFSVPTICILNGRAILRAEWPVARLADGDVCAFVALPSGGGGSGGKNPLSTVLALAVMAASIWTGQIYGGDLAIQLWGSSGVITGTQAAIGTALVTGTVALAGTALVSALVPAGKASTAATSSTLGQSASPTYSLSAQGNQARLNQVIPSMYGRHVIYPDFAAVPYQEYVDNDQYLHQLHCIGQGEYEIEAIRIDDTAIANFDDVEYEVVPPGGTITLLDPCVATADEVSGLELTAPNELESGDDGWFGPFAVCKASYACTKIGVDVAMPRGLYYANDDGSFASRTVTWQVDVREIDDYGDAVGDGTWSTIATETYTAATVDAIYRTYAYTVAAARYEARVKRTDAKDTSSRAGHVLDWVQLRGYLTDTAAPGAVTLLAIKMRASNALTSQTSRQVNVIATRKLPVWSADGGWSDPVATRSMVWACADICRAAYGAKLTDAALPLADFAALADVLAARGDTFNYVFDGQTTVFEALKTAARTGRAVPILQGGRVRLFRDAPQTMPVGMFNGRNIVKGSFSIEYLMPSDDTADAIVVEYFEERTWAWDQVKGRVRDAAYTAWLAAEGLTDTDDARETWADLAENPVTVKIDGITSRAQALREADYSAADNRYRRRLPTFQTEMEGMIPTYGDLISVCHDMPRWGQGGEVTDFSPALGETAPPYAAGTVLTLSEPPEWTDGVDHYIALRSRNGSMVGPFLVTPGDAANQVATSEALTLTPYVGTDAERTYYAFGPGTDQWSRLCVCTALRPRSGGTRVEIVAAVEDARVHVN